MSRLRNAALAVSMALFAFTVAHADTPRSAAADRLAEPAYLPEEARMVLKERMHRHGEQMVRLVMDVTLLHNEAAAETAADIAGEPRLTRPITGGESDVNAALPEQFFVLQDELRMKAKALAQSSRAHDNKTLARDFGAMTQTCVACHSAFLNRGAE